MRAIETLALALKPPRRGWLPFRLVLDDIVIEDTASNVLNDPLASLFDLARHVADRATLPARACLWLEPDGYTLEAEPATEQGFHILRVLYARHFAPQMARELLTLRHEVMIPTAVACGSLVSGLSELLRDPGVDALNHWYSGDGVATYQDRLRKLRPTQE